MNTNTIQQQLPVNSILNGDCIEKMREMPANSVDFILSDPPYLVNYRDRDGRTIQNDANDDWLKPAMAEAYRVLKQNRVAVMFYSWNRVDKFFDAWKDAGFQPVGHIVFRKTYSSRSKFLSYQHEQAYLLAKGRPPLPKQPIADVLDMPYSGNKLHPTQKPVAALAPLVRSFTLPGELVLDPFAGSGSSCAAALLIGRRYIGIEMDAEYYQAASLRMSRVKERIAKRSSPSFPRSIHDTYMPSRIKANHYATMRSRSLDPRRPARSLLFIVGMKGCVHPAPERLYLLHSPSLHCNAE